MDFIIFILFTLALFPGAALAVFYLIDSPSNEKRKKSGDLYRYNRSEYWQPTAFLGGIATFVLFVAGVGLYLESVGSIADLSVRRNNLDFQAQAIEQTNAIILAGRGDIGALTDFAYQDLAKESAARIAEYKDSVLSYNNKLTRLRRFNEVPLVGILFADVPDDLELITLSK